LRLRMRLRLRLRGFQKNSPPEIPSHKGRTLQRKKEKNGSQRNRIAVLAQ